MELKIQATNFKSSENLVAFIEKKIAKLEKLSDSILSVEVFLKVVKFETYENKEAEVKVNLPGADFFASKTCDTFEEAVDKVVEALEKQIKKHKESK